MKITYYPDTDTLHLELADTSTRFETVEISDRSEVFAEKSESGEILAITIESVSKRMNLKNLELENIPFEHLIMNKLEGAVK